MALYIAGLTKMCVSQPSLLAMDKTLAATAAFVSNQLMLRAVPCVALSNTDKKILKRSKFNNCSHVCNVGALENQKPGNL